MNKVIRLFDVTWLGVCIAAFLGYLVSTCYVMFAPSDSPITYLDGSTIHPPKVKAGESVTVARHYIVNREEKITMVRRMKKGDCATGCLIVDLVSSDLLLKVGTLKTSRSIEIPSTVAPGVWTLEFQVQWDDLIGRSRVSNAPPLDIEVIK